MRFWRPRPFVLRGFPVFCICLVLPGLAWCQTVGATGGDISRISAGSFRFEPDSGRNSHGFLAVSPHYNVRIGNASLEIFQPAQPGGKRLSPATIRFLGANPRATLAAERQLSGQTNYLLGNEPRRWRTGVPWFGRLRVSGVWPGVDIVYFPNGTDLEYDLECSAGAALARMQLEVSGVSDVKVLADGSLALSTAAGALRQLAPRAFEVSANGRRRVPGGYRVEKKAGDWLVSFEVDRTKPDSRLLIDPVITASAYIGGSGVDAASGIGTDAQGNLYVSGYTQSPEYSASANAVIPGDGFVAKFTSRGNPVYFTYFGGSSADEPRALKVTPAGEVIVAGTTVSPDFPVSPGAFQTTIGDSPPSSLWGDGFIIKLDKTGKSQVFSTYFGGSSVDVISAIDVNADGEIAVTGWTDSLVFPTSFNAPQNTPPVDGFHAFASKLTADASALVWSTYIGGKYNDEGRAVAFDASGDVVVAGTTVSPDFPVTPGAYQTSFDPGGEFAHSAGFVTKIDKPGEGFLFSTFLGGSGDDTPLALVVAGDGTVFVAGQTYSADFPATAGAFQGSLKGFGLQSDGFVASLSADGARLAWSTYLGGGGQDSIYALARDSAGNLTVAGETTSTDFPTAGAGCSLKLASGGRDAFVSRLNAAGKALVYSAYVGGTADDRATALALLPSGDAAIAGVTFSASFPVVQGGASTSLKGGEDAFMAVLSPQAEDGVTCIHVPGVVNAASFLPGPIAPGEIVSLLGLELGPADGATLAVDSTGHITDMAGGTEVFFDDIPAPIIYASRTLASVVVPYSVSGKTSVGVRLAASGVESNSIQVPVAATAPGIFTLDASGQGAGAILNQDLSLNTASNPAPRGSIVVLYATGEGQTTPAGINGLLAFSQTLPSPIAAVSVRIGGIECHFDYAGAAPTFVAGLMQINVRVPSDAPVGSQVPVLLKVGDNLSQPGVTLAIQ